MKKIKLFFCVLILLNLFFIENNEVSASCLDYDTYVLENTINNSSKGKKIVSDEDGNIFVLGNFFGNVDFDSTSNEDFYDGGSDYDVFLSKYNSDGSYVWTKEIDENINNDARGLVVSELTGSIFVIGVSDAKTGSFEDVSNTTFIVKYNSDGSYAWTKTFGGNSYDQGWDISINSSDEIFVTGSFKGTVDFDANSGTDNYTSNGSKRDIFLSKYNSDGSYAWTKTFGGSGDDRGKDVFVDNFGNIFITGDFKGTVDFDANSGTDNYTSNGGSSDVFFSKYNSDGSYAWTKTFGGSGDDYGLNLVLDNPTGEIIISGTFRETVDFDANSGTDNHTSNGGGIIGYSGDIFLSKYNSDGSYAWTKTFGGSGDDLEKGLSINSAGEIFLGGQFWYTIDFNANSGTDNHTSNGNWDIFLSKYNSDGSYAWTKTFGGSGNENVEDVFVNSSYDVFLTGDNGASYFTKYSNSGFYGDLFSCDDTVSLYRFWSSRYKGHFYTASETERDQVINNYDDDVWRYEGIAYQVFNTQVSESVPVYRFWSSRYKGHFYTASEAEKNNVINNYPDDVWKYEGIAYYTYKSEQTDTKPVYRFWSKEYKHHFYTASEAEKNNVINNYPDDIWKHEGIAWYVED